jgi:hypothetical protein
MTGRKVGPYLVASAITGLLIFLAYLIFFVPQTTATAEFKAQTEAEKASNAGLQSKVDVLEEKKKNLDLLTGQVDNLTAAFPSEVKPQELFSAILKAANAAGVTISTLNPSAPVLGTEDLALSAGASGTAASVATAAPAAAAPAAATTKTPVDPNSNASAPTATAATPAVDPLSSIAVIGMNITARGSQDQLRVFLTNVENLQRPLVISTVEFTSGKDDTSLTIAGNTFLTKPLVAPSDPEVAKPAEAPGASPSPKASK